MINKLFRLYFFTSLIWVVYFFFASSSQAFAQTIKINEFLANQPSGQNEWVEFYNPDHLDLSNYWIDDDLDFTSDAGNSLKKRLSLLDSSNPDFPVFTLSSSMFNDSCSSTCDYVVLFSEEGVIADQYQYTPEQIKQEGKSIGRSPDASGNWVVLVTITKGSQNSLAEPTPTPSPSPTPTSTPTPSKTSTSVPTSRATLTPTSKPTSLPSFPSTEQSAGDSGKADLPTEILGENIAASSTPTVTKKISGNPSATPASKVFGSRENNLPKVLIGLGVISLLACGILAFQRYKTYKKIKDG